MRAALIGLALFSTSVGAFLACSDETGSTPAAGTDGGPESGSARDAAQQGPADASSDAPRSPTGCLLLSTGYRTGAKAENVPRTDIPGAVNWTNVENALA